MHLRRAIRENVKSALIDIEALNRRVFTNRVSAFQDHELPAVVIETPSDTVSLLNTSPVRPRLQRRDQGVNVLIVHAATDDIDDALDDIAEAVEVAMQADPTVGVGATNLELRSTNSTIVGDGNEMRGVLRMQYSVTVSTREGAPYSVHSA